MNTARGITSETAAYAVGMEIFLNVVLLAAGLALIVKGGDFFVECASWIAKALGVPELIIGATVVSVGTTLPELFTSLTAVIQGMAVGGEAAEGFNMIAVGNSIGSMLCNIGLILGLAIAVRPPSIGRGFAPKAVFLCCAAAVSAAFCMTGSGISLAEGIALLVLFGAFVALNIAEGKRDVRVSVSGPALRERYPAKTWAAKFAVFAVSAVAIAGGAKLLCDNAQALCISLGISQQIVGITVVAIGTSLPELVTCMTSLVKGRTDIGVGNIIGANVINGALLLGVSAAVTGSGLPIDAFTAQAAVPAMLVITAVLVVPSLIFKKTFRVQGAILLALYTGFVIYNIVAVT